MENKDENMVSLKEYIEKQFELRDIANRLVTETIEHRLHAMNEFREQLKDQTATFVTRNEHKNLEDKITMMVGAMRDQTGTFLTRREHETFGTNVGIGMEELKKDRLQIISIQAKVWVIIAAGGSLALLLFTHLAGKL